MRSLLPFLALLCLGLSCASALRSQEEREARTNGVQFPLRVHKISTRTSKLHYVSPQQLRLGKSKAHRYVAKPRKLVSQPLTRPVNDSDPVPSTDASPWFDEVLTIDVTVGTPAKQFNLTLDYEWDQSFFFGPDLNAYLSDPNICFYGSGTTRNYYQPSLSSTNVLSTTQFSDGIDLGDPYAPEAECASSLGERPVEYNDTFVIGPLSAQNIPFVWLGNASFMLNPYWPSDAVLGLGQWGGDIFDPTNMSTITHILRNFAKRLLSVFLRSHGNVAQNSKLNGAITFGALDKQNCNSKWTWVSSSSDQNWGVDVSTFAFGTYTQQNVGQTMFASTTSFLSVPPNVVDYIVDAVNAEYNFQLDIFLVDCKTVSKIPDLVFTLTGGQQWRVPARFFVRKFVENPRNQCTLLINANYGGNTWILGSTFLRPYCHAFDYDNQRFGYANPK